MKLRMITGFVGAVFLCSTPANAQMMDPPPPADPFYPKNRVFVLTDVGNEPDDQMSLVRLMLYSNELDIEGLVATTSQHLKDKLHEETLHQVVAAYAQVRPNLMKNAQDWPTAEALDRLITIGPRRSGMAGIVVANPSPGAKALIAAVDRPDKRPLWVTVWGGANTLAEALAIVQRTRTKDQIDRFLAKLRVYTISDQDDSGYWIRREFPKLQYVVSPSGLPEDYASATWTGISGDSFYGNDTETADRSKITNEWLDANIRKGPLGSLYPKVAYIMEGDTPSYLGLTANGLNSAMSPAWGGWGGRYVYRQPYGETRSIWSQGGMPMYGAGSRDRVVGLGGRVAISDQATIWRWRDAFQNDFAARMEWTVKPFSQANHQPVAQIAGYPDAGPIYVDMKPGEAVALDASRSIDPDRGQRLHYRWFHYAEAGARMSPLADVAIEGANTPRATLRVDKPCRRALPFMEVPCDVSQAHVIVEVSDDGTPSLTSYRRIVLRVRARR